MRVMLHRALFAVPEGQVYPVEFPAGTEVDGNVARAAVAQGAGVEIAAETRGAPETRAQNSPQFPAPGATSAPEGASKDAPGAKSAPEGATTAAPDAKWASEGASKDDPPARRKRKA